MLVIWTTETRTRPMRGKMVSHSLHSKLIDENARYPLYDMGQEFLAKGSHGEAVRYFSATIRHIQNNEGEPRTDKFILPLAFFFRAACLTSLGRYHEALRDTEEAIRQDISEVVGETLGKRHRSVIDPEIGVYNLQGTLYSYLNEEEKAIEQFSHIIKLYQNRGEDNTCPKKMSSAYTARAKSFISLGEYEKALIDLEVALKYFGDSHYAYHTQGLAYFHENEDEKAVESFSRVIKVPERETNQSYYYYFVIHSYRFRSKSLFFLKKYHEARRDCTKYLSLWKRAVEEFQFAEDKEAVADILTDRGKANFQLGNFEQVKTDLLKANEIDPKNAHTYCLLGCCFRDQNGDFKKGIEMFNKALLLDPEEIWFKFERGICLSKMNCFAEAVKDLSNVIHAFDHDGGEQEMVRRNFSDAYYFRSYSYLNLREHEKAIEDASKEMELLKENPLPTLFVRACSYSSIEKYELALKDLIEISKRDPNFNPGSSTFGEEDVQFHEFCKKIEKLVNRLRFVRWNEKKKKKSRSRSCSTCFKKQKKMRKCGRCLKRFYCSIDCQKKDWVDHKKDCKEK